MAVDTMAHRQQLREQETHAHPGPRTYVGVALILVAITLAEVGIFYVPDFYPAFRSLLVPAFLVLSAIKFILVVSYYMHLKFDPRFFTWLFTFFLLIAMSVAIAFVALFHGLYF